MTAKWKYYRRDEALLEAAPDFRPLPALDDPKHYLPSEDLTAAVNVAVTLGLPLLVTGEPGCGKTQLAYHLALKFGQQKPLVFNAKTTSTAQDLFYRYDALRHFQAASVHKPGPSAPIDADLDRQEAKKEIMRFVELQALGLAALVASNAPNRDDLLPPEHRNKPPRRPVVLIDEIDKAPRDLPNDILREIVDLTFTIKETGETLPEGGIIPTLKPIIILTSNIEKSLPEAFLRRCAFFHIPQPSTADLRAIVVNRLLRNGSPFPQDDVDEAIDLFDTIREAKLRKRPSTGELLQWVRMLGEADKTAADVRRNDPEALQITYAVLSNDESDLEKIKRAATAK